MDKLIFCPVSGDTIPGSDERRLTIMNLPKARTANEAHSQKQEARERRRRQENGKKAQEAADELFPGGKWKQVEESLYLSLNRPIGDKSNYRDEKRDAEILCSFGSTVYLVPDDSRASGNKYDAIVNGLKFEFKNMKGASVITLKDHFLKSRKQAPNVFISLEKSPLSRRDIMSTLYGARNSGDYARKNKFKGGMIILWTCPGWADSRLSHAFAYYLSRRRIVKR
jgi:hypothetical protein